MHAQDTITSDDVNTDKNIFRVVKDKNNPYLVAHKSSLLNEKLSWKAKGIHLYMLSMKDDWVFYRSELAKHATDGIDSLRSGLMELKEHGYIKIVCHKEGGKVSSWETLVYEIPQTDENLQTEPPVTRNGFSTSGKTTCGESNANKDQDKININKNNNKEPETTNHQGTPKPPVVVSEDLKTKLNSIGIMEPEAWVIRYTEVRIWEKLSFMLDKSKITASQAAWLRDALERDYQPPKSASTGKISVSSDEQERLYQARMKNADQQNIREWEAHLLIAPEEDKVKIVNLLNALRGERVDLAGVACG